MGASPPRRCRSTSAGSPATAPTRSSTSHKDLAPAPDRAPGAAPARLGARATPRPIPRRTPRPCRSCAPGRVLPRAGRRELEWEDPELPGTLAADLGRG
jgi:hypothetical protein